MLKSSYVSKFSVEKNAPIVKIRNVSGNFTQNLPTLFAEFAIYSELVRSTLFIFNMQFIAKRHGYLIIQNGQTMIDIKTHKHLNILP